MRNLGLYGLHRATDHMDLQEPYSMNIEIDVPEMFGSAGPPWGHPAERLVGYPCILVWLHVVGCRLQSVARPGMHHVAFHWAGALSSAASRLQVAVC